MSGSRSAVVCDDDPLLRCVLTRVIGPIGYEVCAEAESPTEALEVIDRVRADVVVLDLALRGGRGEDLLRTIGERRPEAKVVVFSAEVGDHDELLAAGATAVVEKPDFPALEVVLGDLANGGPLREDLRRPVGRPLPALDPPAALSIGGLEPWSSFRAAAGGLMSGDAVLALDLVPSPHDQASWDHVLRTDHRLALARTVASVRRAQDRVSLSPDGIPLVLAVAAHAEAPEVLFRRTTDVWRREVDRGTPIGAYGHIRKGMPATTLLDHAVEAVLFDESRGETPLRMI
ncbi:MAG: response regulator [Acidimicrobiia bacterium]